MESDAIGTGSAAIAAIIAKTFAIMKTFDTYSCKELS
jgi:hypothetical protein